MTPMELVGTRTVLEKELEGSGRWLLIGKLLLAEALLFVWMKHYRFTVEQLGIFSKSLDGSFVTGLVAGGLLVCGGVAFRGLMLRLLGASKGPSPHPQAKGPASAWLLTIIFGAQFEEPWRGFCLL